MKVENSSFKWLWLCLCSSLFLITSLCSAKKKPFKHPWSYFRVLAIQYCHISEQQLLRPYRLYQGTLLQGGCKSKNQCHQILIKYTFLYSKWSITLEKVQNWSFRSLKSAQEVDTVFIFTCKTQECIFSISWFKALEASILSLF